MLVEKYSFCLTGNALPNVIGSNLAFSGGKFLHEVRWVPDIQKPALWEYYEFEILADGYTKRQLFDKEALKNYAVKTYAYTDWMPIHKLTKFDELVNEHNNGIFLDLLPLGYEFDLETVAPYPEEGKQPLPKFFKAYDGKIEVDGKVYKSAHNSLFGGKYFLCLPSSLHIPNTVEDEGKVCDLNPTQNFMVGVVRDRIRE